MSFFVQHQPIPGPPITETYDTETQAETRARNLINSHRATRVVVYEADIHEENQT